MPQAREILDNLVLPGTRSFYAAEGNNIVSEQIKTALETAGYTVDVNVGQSSFKCSLAVKRQAADTNYSLGILLDDATHYYNDNLIEQYYQRPAILQAFGWQTLNVYAKDWLEDRDKVMGMILGMLK